MSDVLFRVTVVIVTPVFGSELGRMPGTVFVPDVVSVTGVQVGVCGDVWNVFGLSVSAAVGVTSVDISWVESGGKVPPLVTIEVKSTGVDTVPSMVVTFNDPAVAVLCV